MEQLSSFQNDLLDDSTRNALENRKWVQTLKKSVMKKAEKAVLHWCQVVVKLGEKDINLEQWINLYESQVTGAFKEAQNDVDMVRERSIDSIVQWYKKVCALAKALEIRDEPLIPGFEKMTLGELKAKVIQKHDEFDKLLEKRRMEFEYLCQRQLELCKILKETPTPVPPYPEGLRTIDALRIVVDNYQARKNARMNTILKIRREVPFLLEQLEAQPTLNFEQKIIDPRIDPINFLKEDTLKKAEFYYRRLRREYDNMKADIEETLDNIEKVWRQLDIDLSIREELRTKIAGKTVKFCLNCVKNEDRRLKELKKSNMKTCISKIREDLVEMWDKCRFNEQQRGAFEFFYSDCYNEDLLEIHERELRKLKSLYNRNVETYNLLKEYDNLMAKQMELANIDHNKDRYQNRGGQLLKEERQRNKILRRTPILESTLKKLSQTYTKKTGGEKFLVDGKTIEQYILIKKKAIEQQKKFKLSAKKQSKETCPVSAGRAQSAKRIGTPLTDQKSRKANTLTPKASGSASKMLTNALKRSSEDRNSLERRKRFLHTLNSNQESSHENNDEASTSAVTPSRPAMSLDNMRTETPRDNQLGNAENNNV